METGAAAWIDVVETQDRLAVQLLRERLDAGESQAIVLAIELKTDLLLMDEARGKRVAEARGLNTTGTLGTLVIAKKQGLIPTVRPLLDKLRSRGFRMSKELYQVVHMLADEGR
jgi:predicted nucleic acid-binding protein